MQPTEITQFSNKEVFWICDKGHSWKSTIANRNFDKGCPYCSNKRVLKGYNDLATTHPKIAIEWHPTKNKKLKPTEVSFGASNIVYWQCAKGHEWKAAIYNRTKGSGCPHCSAEFKTSFPELCVYFYMKKIFKNVFNREQLKFNDTSLEVDVWIPSLRLGIEIDGYRYHSEKEQKDNNKNIILNKNGIKLIRIREIHNKKHLPELLTNSNLHINSSFKTYDDLANMINLVISRINIEFNKNISNQISSKDILEDEIDIRNLIEYYYKENSLAAKYPEITKQWDYFGNGNLTPENVFPNSMKIVSWICPKGHKYKTSIHSRIKGTVDTCPYCSGQKVLRGFNDLATKLPNLANEWCYEKNDELKPWEVTTGTSRKVWWNCKEGHIYIQSISQRANGSKCPYCCNQKVLKGYNDLATINPNLAKEFHPTLNGNLTIYSICAGSGKKVWWICKNRHEWQQIINNRNTRGSMCPECKKLNLSSK